MRYFSEFLGEPRDAIFIATKPIRMKSQ